MATPIDAVTVYKDSFSKNGTNTGKNQTYQGATVIPDLHSINWPNTSNNESTDISALSIGSDAWFLAFDGKGCDGDAILFTPSQQVNDLKSVTRGKSSNWDNEIKSFVIFSSDPSDNLSQGNITFSTYPSTDG